MREAFDTRRAEMTADHPTLVASGDSLSVWISWLEACSKTVGLALVGLSVITYLDIWIYQAVSGLSLSPGVSTGKVQSTSRFRYAPGQPMAWLEIPRLGLSALVAQGDDASTLMRAVGHIPGTALPGEGGNVGLAGHRDTFFRDLEGLETSDTIRIIFPDRSFVYRVVEVGIVRPSQVEVLDLHPSLR